MTSKGPEIESEKECGIDRMWWGVVGCGVADWDLRNAFDELS